MTRVTVLLAILIYLLILLGVGWMIELYFAKKLEYMIKLADAIFGKNKKEQEHT